MKVGDYVRTKKGTIYQFNSTSSKALSGAKKYMVKSSPNIIDLIEVGDIIKYKTDIGTIRVQDVHNSVVMAMIKSKEIEVLSIVTKEHFESMKYKVGELDER